MSAPSSSFLGSLLCGTSRLFGDTGRTRRFKAGDVLFSAGEPGDGFYVIENGRVQISAPVAGGERLLATLGPGDSVGEMAVLDDAPRSATARAETDTEARHILRDELLQVLEKQPALALSLIREFSNRMRALNTKYVDEVVQAERLAIVGRFAATIVHDFKNPLAVIGLAAELACSDHTTPPMRHKAQNRIAQQVERMTNMLQELIEFTRPSGQRPNLRPIEFSRYMGPLADEIRQELAERRVTLVLENEPPAVEVGLDPRRMTRLIHNLLNNAVDEMPEGGTIFLRFQASATELQIDLEDTGRGIAPEMAESIFAPFTTQGKAHGTGLGLAICRKIAEDHGGRIWAHPSPPGKGATFSFTIPLRK
jgi:signal transduction histidine kinase